MKAQQVLIGLLLLCLAVSGLAQSPREVLLLPVSMVGSYQPGTGDQFTADMVAQIAQMAPHVKLDVARPADLSGLKYDAQSQPPSTEEAARLCAAYGATNAIWLQVRFTPEYQAPTAGQPGSLTVAGAARFWAFRASDRAIVIDQPVSVARTSIVPAGTTEAQLSSLTQSLNTQCMNQLAQTIITVAKAQQSRQMTANWGPPRNPSATGYSAAYQTMARAIDTYQHDLDNGDLIGTTDSQRGALIAWRALTPADRQLIEQNYPGTTQWMEGGLYYDVGNYWYPHPYRIR